MNNAAEWGVCVPKGTGTPRPPRFSCALLASAPAHCIAGHPRGGAAAGRCRPNGAK